MLFFVCLHKKIGRSLLSMTMDFVTVLLLFVVDDIFTWVGDLDER